LATAKGIRLFPNPVNIFFQQSSKRRFRPRGATFYDDASRGPHGRIVIGAGFGGFVEVAATKARPGNSRLDANKFHRTAHDFLKAFVLLRGQFCVNVHDV
jgi:hypothetical protein